MAPTKLVLGVFLTAIMYLQPTFKSHSKLKPCRSVHLLTLFLHATGGTNNEPPHTEHIDSPDILRMDISEFRLTNVPSELYYVPDFISEEDEKFILDKVYAAPKPKWVQLLNRRLQHWGGSPSKNGMIVEPIPSWLQKFMDRINGLNIFDDSNVKTNHVLINEYHPGQGIMPHEDGPMFYPTIATINCGSSTVLRFEKKPSETNDEPSNALPQSVQVFLERRSLVIVKGDLYANYLHSIEERDSDTINSNLCNFGTLLRTDSERVDRKTRISLTIRHVLKVSKFKFRLRTT